MIRRPPRSTLSSSSAASDVYKRQPQFSYVDGAFYTQYLHPQTNYAELDGNSVGLVAMCIAPIGLITLRKRRREVLPWFGVGSAVVGTLLLYSHAAGVIWEHIPIVHTAYLNRSQDVELMGLAVLDDQFQGVVSGHR